MIDFLEAKHVAFFHSDTYVDIDNHEQPLQYWLNDETSVQVDTRFEKKANFFVSHVDFQQSYLFQKMDLQTFKMDRTDHYWSVFAGEGQPLLTFYLRLDQNQLFLKKQEYGMPTLIAEVSGFA